MPQTRTEPKNNKELHAAIEAEVLSYVHDPLGFVMFAYPWLEPDTSLATETGPDAWQKDFLQQLGWMVRERRFNGSDPVQPVRMATSSGHGIGKSALCAWLIQWIMSTRPGSQGTITANTGEQLRTKTWSQLAKWHNLLINKHWFSYRNSPGNMTYRNVQDPNEWFCSAYTCRREKTEAFAGQHADKATSFYIFDEAAAVPPEIWEVANGGLTDGEPMMFAFGNPTRNSGAFFDCFNRQSHRWETKQIDSRTAKKTNKTQMQEWIDDYGIDSDYVRVRVRGLFPRSGSLQFISSEDVRVAMDRKLHPSQYDYAAKVMGVDVARFGDDRSVICCRQGLQIHKLEKYRGLDTMRLAGIVAAKIKEFQPDVVFVDVVGVGAGVVDCLRTQMGYKIVRGVNAGSKASRPSYFNLRAEMWGNMNDAIQAGVALPRDLELEADLTALEYGYTHSEALKLEKKEDAKKRGLKSPDTADALALTYSYPIRKKSALERAQQSFQGDSAKVDYDPWAEVTPQRMATVKDSYDPFEGIL